MSYKIHFEITAYRYVSPEIEIPIDHNFWKPLMLYFLRKSDSFRIDCWKSESEAITWILKFASLQDKQSNPNMTLISGELSDEFINTLLNDAYDSFGRIRWFSVFLKKDGTNIFSSEHYGTEFFANSVSKDDLNYIESLLPKDASKFIFQ